MWACGDDLSGTVAVGRVQAQTLQRRTDLIGVATEYRGHSGRFQRARSGHLAAADGGERDSVVRSEHSGYRCCGELPDRVSATGALAGRSILRASSSAASSDSATTSG